MDGSGCVYLDLVQYFVECEEIDYYFDEGDVGEQVDVFECELCFVGVLCDVDCCDEKFCDGYQCIVDYVFVLEGDDDYECEDYDCEYFDWVEF